MAMAKEQIRQIISENNLSSVADVHDQIQDLYGIELSAEMVSKITDKIIPQVKEWQSRPLPLSIPSSLWTASIIKYGKMGVFSTGLHM